MKKRIRLSENDLSKIVRKIINESDQEELINKRLFHDIEEFDIQTKKSLKKIYEVTESYKTLLKNHANRDIPVSSEQKAEHLLEIGKRIKHIYTLLQDLNGSFRKSLHFLD